MELLRNYLRAWIFCRQISHWMINICYFDGRSDLIFAIQQAITYTIIFTVG